MHPTDKDASHVAKAARAGGFSLIELMVAVVVVGILAAIALPSYQSYVQKSRRVDAKNAVLDAAAKQEKFFATNNQYADSLIKLGFATDPVNINGSGQSYYSMSMTRPTISSFTITATPVHAAQLSDACFAYTVNDLGVRANLTAGGTTNTTAGCW